MAKYKKKRARELQHDRFRDTTMSLLDRVGDKLEGRGRQILYTLGGIVVLSLIIVFFFKWNSRKNDEAHQAIGRAIAIATANIAGGNPAAVPTGLTFNSEEERAQRAVEEFQKVAAKYGDPYRTEARYFIATNQLIVDRQKGMQELADLQNSKLPQIVALAKFALAQAKENEGELDEAAQLYSELARMNSDTVSAETANLRLAKIYRKQGKKQQAADLLFNIVDASRKAKRQDETPVPPSGAARDAATELEKLDPDRYAKLPPEMPALG
ncbi:MAG: tol-pal system YbgF family protein [Pyrinomonadaceae bacterium]